MKQAASGLLEGEWSDAVLARRAGEFRISVEASRTDRYGHEAKGWRTTAMVFATFLRTYRARRREQLYAVTEVPRPLAQALTLPAWMPYPCVETLEQAMLWLGAGGQVSLVHNDNRDNLLCVFDGCKQVTLIDGLDGDALYERKELRDKVSPVDLDAPDLTRFPEFARVQPLHATAEAGDVLYIPVGWFHQVHSIGRNLAVNLWFDRCNINGRLPDTGGAGMSTPELLSLLFGTPTNRCPPAEPRPIPLAETRYFRSRMQT